MKTFIEFYIQDLSYPMCYDLFLKDDVEIEIEENTNIDKYRFFLIKYLKKNYPYLYSKEYKLSVYNRNEYIYLQVYFYYDLSISRDIKINKIINHDRNI